MTQIGLLMTGLVFDESPRWHACRLREESTHHSGGS